MSLRPLPDRKIVRILNEIWFETVRQERSHLILKHPDGRVTVVPVHPGEQIGRGLLSKIIEGAKLTREEFLKLLEEA